ncbi:hypothetical protein CJP74_01330 [Psittacicella melopsittaci]|uniref:Type I restriction modification DNA specificity domain-containing protein n=1 Tax=Psittacicella melopsittaci TaxID=2028576 RepID=A0A3A1Y7S4_9GAMM|nr:hypothetical protein CJP74_01330 [Psittacicella melopsittaci]
MYKLLAVQANGQPQLRFTGFSQPWVKEQVKNVFDEITRGQVLAVSKMSSVATPEYQYPVYSSQTLNNGVIGYYKQYLFENAITWTTDGYAGRVTYRPGKFYSTNVNGVLISHRGLANKVIAEALNRVAHKYVAKGGIPKLMNNVMAIVEFEYPVEGEEQAKLSTFFTELDQLIDSYHRQLELYKKLKAALVQKVIVP